MLLRRFSNPIHYGLALFALSALLLAGCATGPGSTGSTRGGMLIKRQNVPSKALTLYEQAVASMAAGDSIDAELRFQEFLLTYPDYPGAHINLAIIFSERGDDQAAEGSLTDALILNSQHPVALNQLGMLLRRQGRFLEAEAAYLKAVTASPDYALAHYNLGVLNELYLQRLATALQHFEQYQSIVGEDKQVERWIADLRRRVAAAQSTANVAE